MKVHGWGEAAANPVPPAPPAACQMMSPPALRCQVSIRINPNPQWVDARDDEGIQDISFKEDGQDL